MIRFRSLAGRAASPARSALVTPLVLFVFAATAANAAGEPPPAAATCVLPQQIEAPQPRRPDFVNDKAPYDHLKLVFSWSPEFCEAEKGSPAARARSAFECSSENRFQWVVHGLWPENTHRRSLRDEPRHCRQPPEALSVELVRRHLCTLPGVSLMQNEWQAHGSCGWASPERYFADIEKIAGAIAKPGFVDITGDRAAPPLALRPTTVGAVRRAFVKANGGRLEADQLWAHINPAGALVELRICLDKQSMQPMRCPEAGPPDDRAIQLRAPG